MLQSQPRKRKSANGLQGQSANKWLLQLEAKVIHAKKSQRGGEDEVFWRHKVDKDGVKTKWMRGGGQEISWRCWDSRASQQMSNDTMRGDLSHNKMLNCG